ncbi:MAG: SPOR domain-containing protein [Treponema sp.]|nr:SPOR domain-containing protein [Treponema sp.]
MEQKKALWISLSAGIFLLTVLGAALFISSQNAKNNVNAVSLKGTESIWISPPPVKKTQSYPTINVTDNNFEKDQNLSESQNSNPISGTYTPTVSEKQEEKDQISLLTQSESNQTESPSLNISNNEDSKSSSGTNSVTAQNAATEKAIKEAKSTAAKVSSENTKKNSSSTASKNAAKSSSSKPAAASKPKAKQKTSTQTTITQYWIQVSSYSAKKNADEARSILDSNSLPCEVFTHTKDGTLYYRVRVGPYATKGEAEKAKLKVDGIAQFKSTGSYVVSAKKEN